MTPERAPERTWAPEVVPVRDAASVILVRRPASAGPQILMGQRGARAVFMPDKFVFPGGAVDDEDLTLADALPPGPETGTECLRRLALHTDPAVARALPLTAVRELWEETGLTLGRPDPAARDRAVAPGWQGFFAAGLVPHCAPLRFVFRAITPPGRPRRFDARFFIADAAGLHGDPDDFAEAGDELAHLQWIALDAARHLALPFITEVVLSEVAAIVGDTDAAAERPVPFFHHDAAGSHVSLI
jgi:8-oxo-dGTP pyrophosphatase MutT (NUDIX family)